MVSAFIGEIFDEHSVNPNSYLPLTYLNTLYD